MKIFSLYLWTMWQLFVTIFLVFVVPSTYCGIYSYNMLLLGLSPTILVLDAWIKFGCAYFYYSHFPITLHFSVVWSLFLCITSPFIVLSLCCPYLSVWYWWTEVNFPGTSPHRQFPLLPYFSNITDGFGCPWCIIIGSVYWYSLVYWGR